MGVSTDDAIEGIGGLDFYLIEEICHEPCYVSEIGRKLHDGDFPRGLRFGDGPDGRVVTPEGAPVRGMDDVGRTWGQLDLSTATRLAASIVNLLVVEDDADMGTETVDAGQRLGSPHQSWSGEGLGVTTEWEDYKILEVTKRRPESLGDILEEVGLGEYAQRLRDIVAVEPWVPEDEAIDAEGKRAMIRRLSNTGNQVSKNVERVFQDTLDRQFRYMDTASATVYDDPAPDYYVEDKGERRFGLMVEVSARWVNPIGEPYVETKTDEAMEDDADVLIMAPRFRDDTYRKYSPGTGGPVVDSARGDIITTVRVPPEDGKFFDPLLSSVADIPEDVTEYEGNPIVVEDRREVRSRLGAVGRVGQRYPIVEGTYDQFRRDLDHVHRRYAEVEESRYRNMVREALEPIFPKFTRPYRVEQYLIDTYWEQGMLQREIGDEVGVSTRTIRRWMDAENWDILTRGFAGETTVGSEGQTMRPLLRDETAEVWERMYRGEEPFPSQMTGYEIQAEYNRHPLWGISEWREWYSLSEEERAEVTSVQDPDREGISYTIMLGPEDRLYPSYSYIISVLRDRGVEIRDGFFGETGSVLPTRKALEYMINSRVDTFDPTGQAESVSVKKMRSSLEVEFAEFLSSQQVAFGYEPFSVPGRYTGEREDWSRTVERLQSGDITPDEMREWERIYEKHNLGEVDGFGVEEGLIAFNKREIVPDFVLYPDAGKEKRGPDWGGWTDWDRIVELAGAWGITEFVDWPEWYRVAGVAYKEFMYKKLGLWDGVRFVVQNSQSITTELRTDRNYVIVESNQMEAGFQEAAGGILG